MRRSLLAVLVCVVGCGHPAGEDDGGVVDAGAHDSGAADSGIFDAGSVDSGVVDSGVVDSGVVDSGVVDSGVVDSGVVDSGVVDSGVVDSGVFDSGIPDAGEIDSGYPYLDAGYIDGGIDTFLLNPPSGTVTATSQTLDFTASVSPARFECALDTRAYSPCMAPLITATLPAGQHVFSVRAVDTSNRADTTPATAAWNVEPIGPVTIRVMASNLTSGNLQSYDPGDGLRIIQGLKPDVVLLQELNYGNGSQDALRQFADLAGGANFSIYREIGAQIPNGILSRYPILDAGMWEDVESNNREWAWVQLDVPGPIDLFAVSVHLLTSSASTRNTEALGMVARVNQSVPPGAYLVMGGDFNTTTRDEPCITTLGQVYVVDAGVVGWPADQNGNTFTNVNRTKSYDWVLANGPLHALATATVIGGSTYDAGLVLDSRVYTPLIEVAPIRPTDSTANNMQHMGVVRDFSIPH